MRDIGGLSISGLPSSGTVAIIISFATVCLYAYLRPFRETPPSPRGLPFFGNTFQVPTKHFATFLKDLHARHGGLVYLNINRQHVFSIGDFDLATELLVRRSAAYSARPTNPFFDRYADPKGNMWAFKRPGENHYWGRKISTNVMKLVKAGHSDPLQYFAAVALIRNIIQDEGDSKRWYEHINNMSASTIVAAMFGVNSINVESPAPEVIKVLELVEGAMVVLDPIASIMNLLPIIDDIIPTTVPTPWRSFGTKWVKHEAEGWAELLREALEGKGAQMSTWASMFAHEGKGRGQLVNQFAIAAIETSASSLHSFVLACVVFPDWIDAAQQELDRIVGEDRLPDFNDRPSLPFIEAIVRGKLRLLKSSDGIPQAIRAGLPHATNVDDVVEYQGKEYFIPKGSTIYAPPHAMEHDSTQYESPDVFRPQRFLDDEGQLKTGYQTSTFGFGRRICIGIPFAERTLWIVVATILWTFNIRKAADPSSGLPFKYKLSDDAYDGRLSSGPYMFPVQFVARDEKKLSVAQREWEDCEKDLNILLPALKSP